MLAIFAVGKTTFGHGWQQLEIKGKKLYGRLGELQGMLCSFYIVPDDTTAFIFLSNDAECEIGYMLNDFVAAMYNMPYTYPDIKRPIQLEAGVLKQYEGRYEMPGGEDIHLFVRDNLLYGEVQGAAEFTLYPQALDKFFTSSVDMTYNFTRDAAGKVTGVTVRQNRRDIKARKWQ